VTTPITRVGKYEILEQVGEGAMGIVYKAKDPILNRTVAIKVMSEGLAHDAALRERFLREAQAAGSLQHPNVVTIYDFGETDGHLFIAMEFIQGADLEHLLTHHAPISLAAKLDIIIDVLNGLSYAHRRGIVHRDIKPANIRVDDEGHARIMDFGVARLSTSNLTSTGVMMGTPNYMAPEQISGEAVGPSVDLFSVGAVLFELLTNMKPFQGDTLHSVLFKIVSETPPSLHTLQPSLPSALNEIVQKGMAKDPEQRYRSAAEFANALSAIRAPLGAARVSKTVSQRVSIEKGLQAQAEAMKQARSARRRRIVAGVVAAAVVIVVGGVGGIFAVRRGGPAEQSSKTAPSQVAITPPAATALATPAATAPDTTRVQPAAATTPAPSIAAPTPTKQAASPPRTETSTKRSAPPVQAPAQRVAETRIARDTTVGSTSQQAAPAVTAPASQPPVATPQVIGPVTPPQTVSAPPKAPEPVPENPTPAITAVVAAYGRAIGTRDVAEVRRVYSGMTPQQQQQWESFFQSVRAIKATFQIASLDVSGNSATAHLTGTYEYTTRAGRTERQPVAFEATLQRDGDRWRLQAIK